MYRSVANTLIYDIKRVPNAELELKRAKGNLYGSERDVSKNVGCEILEKESRGLLISRPPSSPQQSVWSKTLDEWGMLMDQSLSTHERIRRVSALKVERKGYTATTEKLFILDKGYSSKKEPTIKSAPKKSGMTSTDEHDNLKNVDDDPNCKTKERRRKKKKEKSNGTIIAGHRVFHPHLDVVKARVAMSPYLTNPKDSYSEATINLMDVTSRSDKIEESKIKSLPTKQIPVESAENIDQTFAYMISFNREYRIMKPKSRSIQQNSCDPLLTAAFPLSPETLDGEGRNAHTEQKKPSDSREGKRLNRSWLHLNIAVGEYSGEIDSKVDDENLDEEESLLKTSATGHNSEIWGDCDLGKGFEQLETSNLPPWSPSSSLSPFPHLQVERSVLMDEDGGDGEIPLQADDAGIVRVQPNLADLSSTEFVDCLAQVFSKLEASASMQKTDSVPALAVSSPHTRIGGGELGMVGGKGRVQTSARPPSGSMGGIARKAHKTLPTTTPLRAVSEVRPKSASAATFYDNVTGWMPDLAPKVTRKILYDELMRGGKL